MKRKLFIFSIILIILLIVFLIKINISFFVSSPLKKELENLTGFEVSIDKVYLHLIPLYLEIKDLSIYPYENKRESLKITKIKLYIGLKNILNKEIEVRRAVLYNSNFLFSYDTLNKGIENVLTYLNTPSEKLKVKFNSFDIENISGDLIKDDLSLKLKNLYARAILKPEPVFSLYSNIKITSPVYPNINTNFKTSFQIKNNKLILQELKLFDISSYLKSSGSINLNNFLSEFFITGKIFFNSFLNFIGLSNKSDGQININGKILVSEGKEWFDRISFDINFNGSFLLQELMQILKVTEKLEGYTKIIQGKIEGAASNLRMTAKAELKEGNILGVKVEKINTNLSYKNGILQFQKGDINLYSGTAKAYVWITLPKVIKHYVFVEVSKVSSDGIFELINWNPGLSKGVVDGWLLSEGEKFSPKGAFIYFKKDVLPEDVRGKIDWIKGEFASTDKIYVFKSLEFALSKTKIKAVGNFNSDIKTLDFQFEGKTEDIEEFISPYYKAFHGDANFKGNISGKTDNPELNLNFYSEKINVALNEFINSLGKEPLILNNLSGKLTYRKNILIIDKLSSADNILIQGNINFPKAKILFDFKDPLYNLTFNLKGFSIKELYIDSIKNVINATLSVSGFIKEKGFILANIKLTDILLGKDKIFDKAVSSVKYEKNLLQITEANFYSGNYNISAEGYIDFNGDIKITGNSTQFESLKFIKTYAEKLDAKNIQSFMLKNLDFIIKGYYKSPEIFARSYITLKNKAKKTIDGTFNLTFQKNILSIKASLLKNANFDIEGFIEEKKWNIRGNFNSTRIDPIIGFFINNLPEDLVVLADGEFNGKIVNEKLNADIKINRIFTRLYGVGLNNKSQVTINVKDGNIYFNPITLIGQSTELTIKGKVVDYFDILVEGFTDLRPFKALLGVDDIRGRASILVYIYESRKNPEIAGGIDLINSSLTLKRDIPTLSNLNATISFNEDRLIVEKANAVFSEGNIHLGGTIYLKDFTVNKLALMGKFQDVRWIFSPRSWAYLDGDFYLTGSPSQPQLTSNLNVNRGIYAESLDWIQLALKSESIKINHQKESWLSNLKLNIRMQSSDFSINNNLATMALKGDVLIRGSTDNPSLLGWITAKEGWIYFRGNKFEILRLLIQFNDPDRIRPYMNISAKTSISQYNVNLNINGYLDQFNMILSSNPPLAENELLNLLVIGQNGTTQVGKMGVSEATSFVTGQIQSVIEERVRGLTGLDVITVEPSISKTTGSLTPRVTVGKKLMEGKLSVTYSTATGTTAEHIIKVEYLIKKGISLVGVRDEIGGLSGAIKFRFEFH